MMETSLQGNIRAVGLPTILASLNRMRKTGTLSLKTAAFSKRVYLLKGDAIFASSTYEDDRLGEMLIKAGKINMEQYDESVRLLKQTGKRQGAILVELGYLTPKDLFWGVKFQVKEIIYSLFLLEDAEYDFIEGEIPSDEVITLKMSMGNLIYEGVKRIDNWTRIRHEMPNPDTVLRLSRDPVALFQDVELGPQDRKMLSLIDGMKTIKELIDSSWIGSFEGMKILYVLLSIGVIEKQEVIPERLEEREPVCPDEVLNPVSADESAFSVKVDTLYNELNKRTAHELLGVTENADEDTLKKNYYSLTREFHPDRYFNTADPSLKDKLTAIFDALTNAYTALKNLQKVRGKDLQSRKRQTKDTLTSGNAEEQFKKGVQAFKNGNFRGAVDAFKSATVFEPSNAKYWSYLSLSYSKVPDGLLDAEKALLEAIHRDPSTSDHHANLGLIYAMQGMTKNAREAFEKALELDPKNSKAAKGLEKITR